MVRSKWVFSAALALGLAGACSDDDSGDGAAGSGGSANGDAGSGGSSGDSGGSAGSTMSNAGSGGGEATYSAEEACQMFAEVTCEKGAECGLVIPAAVPVCLACTPLVLSIIADECEMAIVGPRSRADVDSCLAGIADNSCDETCSDAPFEGCEAFDELPSGDGVVECDPQCL